MRKIPALLSILFASSISFGALAAGDPEDHVDAVYESAKQRCDALSGNEKDVCIQRAKASKTEAQTKLETEYKVAKEKCDALSGDAKDQCVEHAEEKYGQ